MGSRINNNSGIILLVTIWMLIILSVLAVGVGHRNSIGVKLSRYSIDRLKAYYIAKAALQMVAGGLEKDVNNYDTFYECGLSLESDQTPEEIFKDVPLAEGYYTVSYKKHFQQEPRVLYGLIDEERKININALNYYSDIALEKLLMLLDVDSETAKTIASSVVDWHDSDSNVTNIGYGAEDDYYMGLEKSYHCKNFRFESLEELLLIKGVSKEIFLKIKDYLSIYPLTVTALKVNVNTADRIVLQALARSGADLDANPQTGPEEADGLAQKIVDYRTGDDNIEATGDDRRIDMQNPGDLGLFGAEESLFVYLKSRFLIEKSDYFRVKVKGIYKDRKVVSEIEAVLSREELAPVYWHEE